MFKMVIIHNKPVTKENKESIVPIAKNFWDEYFNYPKETYKMSLIPSLIILVGGVYLMIKIRDMDVSKWFTDGIFSIDFFKPLRDLYNMAKF